jgi:hypothetical protein
MRGGMLRAARSAAKNQNKLQQAAKASMQAQTPEAPAMPKKSHRNKSTSGTKPIRESRFQSRLSVLQEEPYEVDSLNQ